jgi:predicted hotdog family 3-hydroxylacyl-ACP dehydratase
MKLSQLIPHQPPMRLLDTLVSSSERDIEVTAQITTANAFYDPESQAVPAWTGIEYMAQTAAAWVGLQDLNAGKTVEPAFLISSRQYTAHCAQFALGQTLRVWVHAHLIEGPLVAFNGAIKHNETLLAEAVFTAYRPDDVAAYLAAAEPT